MSVLDRVEAVATVAAPQTLLAGLAVRLVSVAVVVGLIAFAIWWIFIHPAELRQQAAQGKADTEIAKAAAGAGADALKITVDVQQQKASIDATTGANQHAILSAAGASAPVDPELDRAMRAALCLREAYRAEPDCAPVPAIGGGLGPAAGDTRGGTAE